MARLNLRQSGSWIGMAGMACLLWLYIASALFAPWWGVVLLVAIWLVMFVLATRWFLRRPYAVLLLPVAGVVLWVGIVSAGEAWFGWTA